MFILISLLLLMLSRFVFLRVREHEDGLGSEMGKVCEKLGKEKMIKKIYCMKDFNIEDCVSVANRWIIT